MKILREVVDGVDVLNITDDVYSYSFCYYSANKWIDDTRIVLLRSKELTRKLSYSGELVIVDIEKGTEEKIVDFVMSYIVCGNKLYYSVSDELRCLDLDTREDTLLNKGMYFEYIHATKDGRYLNNGEVITKVEGEDFKCYVYDTVTKELTFEFQKVFNKPFSESDHAMICPTDRNKIFFAHEGDTFYVSNRLWMYEKDKGMKCIAEQRLDEDGNLGDCFGHECWAPDGKGLYFVKYACSPVGPRGLSYVNADGTGQRTAIYSKYPYWHVCASPDGRYLASDTQSGSYSGVCLIDMQTNCEKMFYKAQSNWAHPTHPHPSFNLDGSKLMFHHMKDNKNCIGIVNVKDII